MLTNAYALLDTKSGIYSAPWFFPHDSYAIRAVVELGRDVTSMVGKYPADFVLCRLGTFDDVVGCLASPVPVVSLGLVAALIGQESLRSDELSHAVATTFAELKGSFHGKKDAE